MFRAKVLPTIVILGVWLVVFLLAGSSQVESQFFPTPTPTPDGGWFQTPTPAPPTPTPISPTPTNTPKPQATSTPKPILTPTPMPTSTPAPPVFGPYEVGDFAVLRLEGQGYPVEVWWYLVKPGLDFQGWLNPGQVLSVAEDLCVYLDVGGAWEVIGAMHWMHRRPDRDANGNPLPTPTPEPGGGDYEIPPPPGLNWKDAVTFEFEVFDTPIFMDGFESGGHDKWSVVSE